MKESIASQPDFSETLIECLGPMKKRSNIKYETSSKGFTI